MGLYTGQRKGDVLGVRWADIENGGINFKQQKTGARVWVPVLPELEAILGTIPKRSLNVLTSTTGRIWSTSGFDDAFARCIARLEITGYVFHGLRKNAAVRLAEAGCTTEQIKAWTGHASDRMVSHYAKGASQKRLANAARVQVLKSAK